MSQDILWIDHGWTFSTNFLQESYMARGSFKAVQRIHHYHLCTSVIQQMIVHISEIDFLHVLPNVSVSDVQCQYS